MVKLMNLEEGVDWYRDPVTGNYVWTSKFLLERGFCCHGGCRHCPYDEKGAVKSEHQLKIDVIFQEDRLDRPT